MPFNQEGLKPVPSLASVRATEMPVYTPQHYLHYLKGTSDWERKETMEKQALVSPTKGLYPQLQGNIWSAHEDSKEKRHTKRRLRISLHHSILAARRALLGAVTNHFGLQKLHVEPQVERLLASKRKQVSQLAVFRVSTVPFGRLQRV